MSKPIYVLWRANLRPNAYELSEEEMQEMKRARDESLTSVGGKKVLQLDTRWSTDKWQMAGVNRFPSLEALQKHTNNLEEAEWFRAFESESLLGLAIFDKDYEMSEPIYVLWRLNMRPKAYELPEEKVQQMKKVRDESLISSGGKKVLQLDTRWSNGRWQWAGVNKFPSLEAQQAFSQALENVKWYQAVETETLLGVE